MKYQDFRQNIKSGDLLAFSHGDWKSWNGIKVNFVRIFTRSTYSHVGIAWVTSGRVFVLEAVKPKLRIFPLSLYGDFYHIGMDIDFTPEVQEFALSKIGINYSEYTAIKAYFNPLPEGTVSECAAYTREVFLKAGIKLGELARPDEVVLSALDLNKQLIYIEATE